MRILYDGQIFTLQNSGGVNRYFAELIDGLPSDFEPILTTCIRRTINFPQRPYLDIRSFKRFGFWPGRISYWCEGKYFSYLNSALHPNIIHPTFYSTLSSGSKLMRSRSRRKCALVVTVYDMVQERFPEYSDQSGEMARLKKSLVEAADAVICLSNATRDDLIDIYSIDETKIKVVHIASEICTKHRVHDPIPVSGKVFSVNENKPILLFVGNRWLYKNFDLFLKMGNILKKRKEIFRLGIVGPKLFPDELRQIEELGLHDEVIDYGPCDDRQLIQIYRSASALIYPSKFEGFGIPPLEAFECGVPVIAARSPAVAEVVSDSALLFDPYVPSPVDELVSHVQSLFNSQELRERLIRSGYLQAKKFTWKSCVEQTVQVYQSVAER